MTKIFLNFLLLPLGILLASVSCQDHYIPPTPPAIQTNEFEFASSRRTEQNKYPLYFNCQFTSLGIGAADITEYGILYISDYDGTPSDAQLKDGGIATKVVFADPVVLNTNRSKFSEVDPFYEIYYRAYAKSATSGFVYGEILSWSQQD
jgi:hypothetical protein